MGEGLRRTRGDICFVSRGNARMCASLKITKILLGGRRELRQREKQFKRKLSLDLSRDMSRSRSVRDRSPTRSSGPPRARTSPRPESVFRRAHSARILTEGTPLGPWQGTWYAPCDHACSPLQSLAWHEQPRSLRIDSQVVTAGRRLTPESGSGCCGR